MTFRVAEFQQTASYEMQHFREAYEVASGSRPGVMEEWPITVTGSMQINVGSATTPGFALIDATPIGGAGLYFVESASQTSFTISNGNATNPRIDQVYLQVTDTAHGGGSDQATMGVLEGTPTAGATLSNRNGALALPAASIRLYDILVPAAATSITTLSNIRAKSLRTRGYHAVITANGTTSTTSVATQTGPVAGTAANTVRTPAVCRVQSWGGPIFVRYTGLAQLTTLGVGATFPQSIMLVPLYSTDATSFAGGTTWTPMNTRYGHAITFYAANQPESYNFDILWDPPASNGDYLVGLGAYLMGASGTAPVTNAQVLALTGNLTQVVVEELPQPLQTLRNN